MYVITDDTEYELPLAVADSLKELAVMCNTTVPIVCRVIRKQQVTKMFGGIKAKIFKVNEE